MDYAQSLIRTVARAFYQTRHVLVLDALIVHACLPADDLASVLSMSTKELRKLCSQLREDRLVSVETVQEIKVSQGQEGKPARPQNRDYYYINYHLALDAVKLRIVRLEQKIRDLYAPLNHERKEWQCGRCKAQWTEMEVLSKFDPTRNGFGCPRCDGLLDRNEVSAADRAGSERSSRLMLQLDRLVGLDGILRKIDGADIPPTIFQDIYERRKPIQRSSANPGQQWRPAKREQTNDAVLGVKVEVPQVQVSFTTKEETENAEAEKKKQRLEQQKKNALPEWHTLSTLTGEKTGLGDQEETRMKMMKENLGLGVVDANAETKPATDDNEYITQYYRDMAEAAAQARQQAEEDEEDDEDDDEDGDDGDEFEDVIATGTPASISSVNDTRNKRKLDDSDLGSAINTAASTPNLAESPSKRVKIEGETVGEDYDDDEDDEDEFEDVAVS